MSIKAGRSLKRCLTALCMTTNFSMKVQLFGKILLIGLKERVTIPTKSLQLVIVQLNSENKTENKQFKKSCFCNVTHCILPCEECLCTLLLETGCRVN